MIGFPLGLLYANAVEWATHKYVLHGLGKKKDSFWAFHWNQHHKASRKNEFFDEDYTKPALDPSRNKETLGLAALTVAHLPLAAIAPFFTAGLVYGSINYYRKHKKSHLDPHWARRHLPWHYDHHMGPNQDANWCVTRPWFDYIMGTREKYVGTEKDPNYIPKPERRGLDFLINPLD